MRSHLRSIGLGVLSVIVVLICLYPAGHLLVPLVKDGKVSLVSDSCAKMGDLLHQGSMTSVLLPTVFVIIYFCFIMYLLSTSEFFLLKEIPKEYFRPPSR